MMEYPNLVCWVYGIFQSGESPLWERCRNCLSWVSIVRWKLKEDEDKI